MPRYFFHIRDDGLLVTDVEGVELPDIPDLEERLLKVAREVLAEEEWKAELTDGRSFEIVNEEGRTILVVPFRNLQFLP
ncbi:DUF6894 family protein [Microbaculum marinisediminis]|uniref:DUF6894 domain-containing protein n=1 Tax=Microbaculum marinisediminis TaxID=2931392 RepID=A0AAW5QVL1_9HYPH|nr:hypothetical protein [Microbaculum sp. A6E488]MCT8971050.1 hypothetical protein [Microbaculum sp. A6E488]